MHSKWTFSLLDCWREKFHIFINLKSSGQLPGVDFKWKLLSLTEQKKIISAQQRQTFSLI